MRINKESAMHLVRNHISIKAACMKTNFRKVHIAMLVKRGKLLGIATNYVGSRTSGCGYDTLSIHAERALLKKIGDYKKLDGATMIVIRISSRINAVGDSRPCETCQPHMKKCMREYGMKCVYYSE
jgi:hypothetical protein